jgi:hypothetical protein
MGGEMDLQRKIFWYLEFWVESCEASGAGNFDLRSILKRAQPHKCFVEFAGLVVPQAFARWIVAIVSSPRF